MAESHTNPHVIPKFKTTFNNYIDEAEELDQKSDDDVKVNSQSSIKLYSGNKPKVLTLDELYPKMVTDYCEMSKQDAVDILVKPYLNRQELKVNENIASIIKL